ncbi:hypothetical protein [Lysinibacillus sp. NPDC047702]|uniref:hypothetical protein n=1 Tax=unclassified Lysinibacillus TaxID=2636778 RepID=UPI003CFCC701
MKKFIITNFLFLFLIGSVISYYGIYVSRDDWSFHISSIGGALMGYSIYVSLKLYFHVYKRNTKESIKN